MTTGEAGLLDTSVVIALPSLADPAVLPGEPVISAVTLAELTIGPLVARTPAERARRQAVLQQAEADFEPLPFDAAAARAFGTVAAAFRSKAHSSGIRCTHRVGRTGKWASAVYGERRRLRWDPGPAG